MTIGLPVLFTWRWPLRTTDGQTVTDLALWPLAAGVLVGRVVHLLLDDARSLTRLGDFLIIRSGVEFWPGVVAGLAVVARGARRDQVPVAARLADIAPAALVAQAGYHLTCLFRDGCYGPHWAVGPTPKGLSRGMLPVELLSSGVLVAVAATLAVRRLRPLVVILLGIGSVAAVRAVTSIWLPRLGRSLTRQHTTSIFVAVACAAILAVVVVNARRVEGTSSATPAPCS